MCHAWEITEMQREMSVHKRTLEDTGKDGRIIYIPVMQYDTQNT
jgi:hypothetical protein